MANCKYCGAKTRFLENICQECLSKDSDSRSELPSSSPGQGHDVRNSKYGAARGISSFSEFVGWILIAGGIVISLVALANDMGAMGIFGGVTISVSGLYLVMAAQFVRATVDNVDTTREILELLQKKD